MQTTDYQLLANVRDAVMDVQGDGAGGKLASFNAPSLQAKAALNGTLNGGSADVGYTIELRVAWSDLGVTAPADGKLMRLDLAVGDKDAATQPVESFDWAALTSTYNNPNGWKGVRLVVDATAPSAPANPALAVVSPSAITFSWAASSSSDVARYLVYRGTTPTLNLLTTLAGSPFSDTGLQPSTTYTYQVSAVDAAGNESARTTPVSATTQGIGGIPYGPFGLWQSYTTVYFGPAPFTASIGASAPGGIITQINAARNMGLRLVLCLAGCAHAPVTTNDKFDLTKWKTLVSSYKTDAIQAAVAAAVADGTVIGNSLIDEPEHSSWGGVPTKPMLDGMATHAKTVFPSLPMGVQFGGQASYTWRTAERFQVVDFMINQYSWRLFSGDAATYRAKVLAQAALEGVTPAFSLNILAGGVPDDDGVYDCAGAGQGGIGVNGTNCRMTAAQLRDFGRALGPSGCVLTMWTYDATFFGRADNQQAFRDVASTLGATQPLSCRRPT
jgi:hypothetical protein